MDQDLARKLAFVAPERRKEVERRLAVIERYRGIEAPTMEDVDAAAAALGISHGGFYRLLKAWARRFEPADLERISGSAGTRSRIDHAAGDFIREAFARMPAGRLLEHDIQDVIGRGALAGIDIRNGATLRALIRQLRAERDLTVGPPRGLVLDHVALELPVDAGDDRGPVMPIATVIAHMQTRIIATVRLDVYSASPTSVAAAITKAAAEGAFVRDPDAPSSLEWVRGEDDGWDRLESALAAAGVVRSSESGTTIRGGGLAGPIVFPTLLGVPTRPGIVSKPMHRRRAKVRARGDAVLALAEAQRLMDERLAYSGAVTIPFSSDPTLLSSLSA